MNLTSFTIFLVFRIAFGSLNFLEKKARWSTEIPGEVDRQLSQRIFVPLPDGTRYEHFRPATPLGQLANDTLREICLFTDPFSVWNLGLTCKYFGYVVRDKNNGLFRLLQNHSGFFNILWNSDLTLYGHMKGYLRNLLEMYWNQNHISEGDNSELVISLKKMLRVRAGDLAIAAYPIPWMSLRTQPKRISKALEAHLYEAIDGTKKYCLPPLGTKLFDCIDAREIVQLIQTDEYANSFCYSLLMDYIIPSYNKFDNLFNAVPLRLSDHELTALRFMNMLKPSVYVPYFECLNLAIYFLTNAVRVNDSRSKHIRTPIEHHLDLVGLKWRDVWNSKMFKGMDAVNIKRKLPMMPAILVTARHWGLDWRKIAENTAEWAPVCQGIVNGTIPKYLDNDFALTRQEFVKIFTGNFVNPLYLCDGELVTARNLKRSGCSTGNLAERPKKRSKIEAGPSIPLTYVRNIQENVRMLMESGAGGYQVVEISDSILELCELLDGQLRPADFELESEGGEEVEGTVMTTEYDVSPYFLITKLILLAHSTMGGPTPIIMGPAPAPLILAPAPLIPAPAPLIPAPAPLIPAPAPLIPAPAPLIPAPAPLIPAPAPLMPPQNFP